MARLVSLQAIVQGRVQGVLFRDFVARHAEGLGVTGFVRNLRDGTVEVQAEGEKGSLERLIDYIKIGPPAARVEKVELSWGEATGSFPRFDIRH